ncbi:MAG: hypothetical protein LYZ69_05615 [Nitrososphaerales archaeon]|nr:hypothetical protein [Nitrososphaerales archaeon]
MRTVVYTGLAVSLIGAVLDFVSGFMLTPMTGGGMAASFLSAVALYVLGGAVLIVGVLLLAPSMAGRMNRFGVLMEVFGVVMALASGLVPGMNVGLSYAMLVIGGLMILNGALMQRRNKAEMK